MVAWIGGSVRPEPGGTPVNGGGVGASLYRGSLVVGAGVITIVLVAVRGRLVGRIVVAGALVPLVAFWGGFGVGLGVGGLGVVGGGVRVLARVSVGSTVIEGSVLDQV